MVEDYFHEQEVGRVERDEKKATIPCYLHQQSVALKTNVHARLPLTPLAPPRSSHCQFAISYFKSQICANAATHQFSNPNVMELPDTYEMHHFGNAQANLPSGKYNQEATIIPQHVMFTFMAHNYQRNSSCPAKKETIESEVSKFNCHSVYALYCCRKASRQD